MLRNEKEAVIAEVAQLLTDTENLFVSDYRGLTVAELTELRGKLRESGASFKVVKNTLGGHRRRPRRPRGRQGLCSAARPRSRSAATTSSPPPRRSPTSPRRTRSSRCAAACSTSSVHRPGRRQSPGQPAAARRPHRPAGRHHGRAR